MKTKAITVRLKSRQFSTIERIATKLGVSPNKLVAYFLTVAVDRLI